MTISEITRSMLFPETCMICGKIGPTICCECQSKIRMMDFPICIVCNTLCLKGKPHLACQSQKIPDAYLSPYFYQNPVDKIILKAKGPQNSRNLLKSLMTNPDCVKRIVEIPKVDLIIPIPMTAKAGRFRRLNHAEFIAYELQRYLRTPVKSLLTKSTHSKSQKALDRNKRLTKIAGQISLKGSTPPSNLNGKSILLVDDVVSTGATMIEATNILREYGASKVYAFALAHTPRRAVNLT